MRLTSISAIVAAIALASTSVAGAAAQHRAGPAVAKAKPNINAQRAKPTAGRSGAGRPQAGRNQAGRNDLNRSGNNSGRNRNVVAGNTVVVGGSPGRGYYDDGRYYGHPDWEDDDDNDFLEFVGKTAAVTAGVAAVSAVIGSVVRDKPSGCEPVMSGGQQYQLCNGTYYQPVSNGYQVVAPPQ